MHALLERSHLVLQAFGHDFEPEVQEVPKNLLQIEALGATDLRVFRRDEAGEVDGEGDLQRGVFEEVRHDHLLIGVLLQLERDSDVLGREVLHIQELGQLSTEDDFGDSFHQLRLVHGIGNAFDVDRLGRSSLGTDVPRASKADRARTGLVDLFHLLDGVQNLTTGGEVRAFDIAAQLSVPDVLVVEELDEGRAELLLNSAAVSGRHSHGNTGRSIHEEVRDSCGKHHWFGFRAVVTRAERHRRLLDFGEHFVADAGQPALGVPHRSGTVAIERPEVARTVHQRIPERKGLRHPDERLVERRVAVGVKSCPSRRRDLRAFAMLHVRRQVLLPHRVQDAALNRFQAVADVWPRAGSDDRECVVEIAPTERLHEEPPRWLSRPVAVARRSRGARSDTPPAWGCRFSPI